MRCIIRAKAKRVPEYRRTLLELEDMIVEAVSRDYYLSCGVNNYNVLWK